MRCPVQNGNPDILLDFCARRLPPEAEAILSQHMLVCLECRQIAEAQETVWSALDSWKPESISPDFDDRLYARITEEERRTFWSRIFGDRLSWKPALPLAAGCAAMALALIVNMPRHAPVSVQAPEMRVENIDAEQLERAVEDMEMLRQFSSTGQIQTL